MTDLAIGDPLFYYGQPDGAVFIVWGGSGGFPAFVDLSDQAATHLILHCCWGPPSCGLGNTVHVVDIGGSAVPDVVMGGNSFWVLNPRAFVFYGDAWIRTLREECASFTPWTSVISFLGAFRADFPADIASADVDGDATQDLLLGAPAPIGGADPGSAVVIRGPVAPGSWLDLPVAGVSVELLGIDPGDAAGVAVSGGDVDRDGFGDVLIGAQGAEGLMPGESTTGEVYVVHGEPSFFTVGTRSLGETDPGVTRVATVFGRSEAPATLEGRYRLGSAILLSDIDSDGGDDLVLGASLADGLGRSQAGEVYLFSIVTLARNDEVTRLSPLSPAKVSIFPLDFLSPPPSGDRYRVGFVAGSDDPEAWIVTDVTRPLVFYQVDKECNSLLLAKSTSSPIPDTLRVFF